ncbi:RING-H2 finger protein ATL39 [Brachypodium distachyon]|uniref:RING-H2 finger protein ATL39 n=1 Tax=Brachypodium distachyon TaxID=15368 RepID=UPI0001C72599|nr:RING-H2 finger protein ATL39 [Brachypodium distachyon]|eukprot:XP_003566333.1 RING-H2 finger protein ATL39 [Brachypodium distachyon]
MHTIGKLPSAVPLVQIHLLATGAAMSTAQQSGSPTHAAAAAVETSSHWAPHGPVLTACLVSINLLMILLIFFYFWRFFSGKRGPSSPGEGESSSADTSPATSPRASSSSRRRREDIASSLPVSVFDSSRDAADRDGDCAVCIVEFRDGELARLLPRCGHRFHAACVDAWLRLHATCPLCRASVVAPAGPDAAAPKNGDPKDDGAADECPV